MEEPEEQEDGYSTCLPPQFSHLVFLVFDLANRRYQPLPPQPRRSHGSVGSAHFRGTSTSVRSPRISSRTTLTSLASTRWCRSGRRRWRWCWTLSRVRSLYYVPLSRSCYSSSCDARLDEDAAKIPDVSIVESSAEMLYGLVHQRYILGRAGQQAMVRITSDASIAAFTSYPWCSGRQVRKWSVWLLSACILCRLQRRALRTF